MDAQDYLESIRSVKRNIELIEYELDHLDKEAYSIPGINYERDKVTSSPSKDGIEQMVIRHLEDVEKLTQTLLEEKQKYMTMMDDALKLIRMLPSVEQQEILIFRYVENRKWWDILRLRDCDSLSSQMRLKDRAIDSFQELLNAKD